MPPPVPYLDATDHYFQPSGTVYPLAGQGNESWKYFHAVAISGFPAYCLGKRAFDGRCPVVKLLRHGLMSRPPRRVNRA
jgi:hypothetical protein